MDDQVVKIGQALNKLNLSPTNSKVPPSKPILIDVVLASNSNVVAVGLDKYGLKRFSQEAMFQTPSPELVTRSTAVNNAVLSLPPISKVPATCAAFQRVLEWIEANKKAHTPTPIFPIKTDTHALLDMVDLYAAYMAFKPTIQATPLRNRILEIIRNRPITAEELVSIWTHLPQDHRIVTAAVSALTYFYLKWAIADEENDKIEAYLEHEDALKALFVAEEER